MQMSRLQWIATGILEKVGSASKVKTYFSSSTVDSLCNCYKRIIHRWFVLPLGVRTVEALCVSENVVNTNFKTT